MFIESIEKIVSGVTLYRVTYEGGSFTVHTATLKRLNLKAGMEVDGDTLRRDIAKSEAAEAREFSLRSLAARGRTAGELKDILLRKGFSDSEAAVAVTWLKEKGLIDEALLLEDTAESLLQRKGIHQVRQILKQRGFSMAEAERVLKEKAQEPELYQRVLRQAQRKREELQARYPDQWRQRLGAWLYGKGHDGELIRRVIRELRIPDPYNEE